jgi:hypothetical protein
MSRSRDTQNASMGVDAREAKQRKAMSKSRCGTGCGLLCLIETIRPFAMPAIMSALK